MLDSIVQFDQWLFFKVNHGLGVSWLDPFFLFLSDVHRNKIFMLLIVLFIAGALVKKYGKSFWKGFLLILISISLSDLIGYRILKPSVARERPFQSESLDKEVRKVGHAHGKSFPSNHAANSFAGAASLSYLFPQFSYFFYIYAGFVALSRVYVGVHYPLDIFFGALLGLFVAFSIRRVFKNQLKTYTGPKP